MSEILTTDSSGKAFASRINGTYNYLIEKLGYENYVDSIIINLDSQSITINLTSDWILDNGI